MAEGHLTKTCARAEQVSRRGQSREITRSAVRVLAGSRTLVRDPANLRTASDVISLRRSGSQRCSGPARDLVIARPSPCRSRYPPWRSGTSGWPHDFDVREASRFGERALRFQHPCGLDYELVGIADDDRKPYSNGCRPRCRCRFCTRTRCRCRARCRCRFCTRTRCRCRARTRCRFCTRTRCRCRTRCERVGALPGAVIGQVPRRSSRRRSCGRDRRRQLSCSGRPRRPRRGSRRGPRGRGPASPPASPRWG
jgi:hypothetical protein